MGSSKFSSSSSTKFRVLPSHSLTCVLLRIPKVASYCNLFFLFTVDTETPRKHHSSDRVFASSAPGFLERDGAVALPGRIVAHLVSVDAESERSNLPPIPTADRISDGGRGRRNRYKFKPDNRRLGRTQTRKSPAGKSSKEPESKVTGYLFPSLDVVRGMLSIGWPVSLARSKLLNRASFLLSPA